MRLINADDVKKVLKTISYNDNDDLARTEKLIDDSPTVYKDAQYFYNYGYREAKRKYKGPNGRWLYHEEAENYECSYCGRTFDFDYRMNFCGFCGADMREYKKRENKKENE